jgi:hypothetical protein
MSALREAGSESEAAISEWGGMTFGARHVGPLEKPKSVKRMRVKPRRVSATQRKDLAYAAKVRAKVAKRDGFCRVGQLMSKASQKRCDGPLAWCHLQGKRRAQTRRMSPGQRHGTAWTAILCSVHAEMEEKRQLTYRYLTDKGADGPMLWTLPSGDQIVEAA